MEATIDAVIFDLGGVLIDWNPEYLYRKIFTAQTEMRAFLSSVCTLEWNEEQDAGRSLEEGTALLVRQFPHYETEIRAYYGRWEEMLGTPIAGTIDLLRRLKEQGMPLFALTNWSAETYPLAAKRYDFLGWFDGVVVSGAEKDRKPFASFYRTLLTRYSLDASRVLFIDDNARNVEGAEKAGLQAIRFHSPEQLAEALRHAGVLA